MENSNFQISQQYEIVPPEKSRAYVILVKEWVFIKTKITEIKTKLDWFVVVGSILLGGALSSLITNLATDFKEGEPTRYICWSVFFIMLITGIVVFFFGLKSIKIENKKPKEVIDNMDLIEARFKKDDNNHVA